MNNSKISKPKADFQIMLWEKEAEDTTSTDLYLRIQKLGLPEEVASRLHDLLSKTSQIGKKLIHVGKIILLRILEFVEKNFFLVAGIGVGVLVGAAVSTLVISMPILGAHLAGLGAALKIATIGTGAVIGHDIDAILPNVGKSISEIAKEFFQFLVDVFSAILDLESISFKEA